MVDRQLARSRLAAQRLVGERHPTPTAAVVAFGAMQGQDLPGALASAALRSTGRIDDVLAALDAGLIVRGYPMRGTVFLTPAADLRWMSELCGTAALRNARMRRERNYDFTADDIDRIYAAVRERAAGVGISRAEYQEIMAEAGVEPSGGRSYHTLYTLIAECRLCYGRWNGREQQIMLADELLGPGLAERFGGDEIAAVAELASRYFLTHGPATLRDFVWWSKLPLTKARRAVGLFSPDVAHLGEETFARASLPDELAACAKEARSGLLLPGFDEFVLGYRDRLFAMDEHTHTRLVPGNNGVFKKSVVVDGQVRGTWTRAGAAGRRRLELEESATLPKSAGPGLRRRFEQYPFVGE